MDQIDDFFEYFMRPWMAVMYQETFDDLMNDINYVDVGKVLGFVSHLNRRVFFIFCICTSKRRIYRKKLRVISSSDVHKTATALLGERLSRRIRHAGSPNSITIACIIDYLLKSYWIITVVDWCNVKEKHRDEIVESSP